DAVHDDMPCTRDPDGAIYRRSEGRQVLLGAFQKHTKAWLVERPPDDFSFRLLDPDWEKFTEPLREGEHRLPPLAAAGYEKFVNGPESFTPDNNFILGAAPELDGLYISAGYNSAGIATAGGAGEVLAQWIVAGEPPMDLWSVDPRRFAAFHNNRAALRDRVTEALGVHYGVAWPNYEFESGRGLRRSTLHDRLAATRLGCYSGCAATTWTCPWARSFTPDSLTSAARSRVTCAWCVCPMTRFTSSPAPPRPRAMGTGSAGTSATTSVRNWST